MKKKPDKLRPVGGKSPTQAASKKSEKAAGIAKAARPRRSASLAEPLAVVGVGASAGGLQALEAFFAGMPGDTGAAFLVVTHQMPKRPSMLPELMRKHTTMEVREVEDGLSLAPNTVYFSRPDSWVGVESGRLRLTPALLKAPHLLPIDHCFRALAEDAKERAVGIVLSGTGTDGTLGLRAIKGAGGVALAQSADSAKYPGMPQSAVSTGLLDAVVQPQEMAGPLRSFLATLGTDALPDKAWEEAMVGPLQRIYQLLRQRTGHDFAQYKPNTIRRRIERRIGLQQIGGPKQYVRYIQEHPHEVDLLFKDLLIGVTSFFRDPALWEMLQRDALLPLLTSRRDNAHVRVWVPGCATGEEAYSLAMTMLETAEQLGRNFSVQIFGTDLDGEAIDFARAGVYPEGIAADVSPARLKRFFVREEHGYRIKKEVREALVFATQNVLKDPPFTKLDLISCRNLLIYFNAEAQRRLLSLFHYALKPEGLLLLGPSETVAGMGEAFVPLDKRWKLFRRASGVSTSGQLATFSSSPGGSIAPAHRESASGDRAAPGMPSTPVPSSIERALLAHHVPPSVVTNDRGDIVHIHGRTGEYLEPAAGQPRLNVLEMAREGLRVELAAALRQAVGRDGAIRRDVRMRTEGGRRMVRIVVERLAEPESIRGLLLVSFDKPPPGRSAPDEPAKATSSRVDRSRIEELERELQYTRENLQSTVEELEASNEELKSTNEELQSTNEELQSTNEELETSKEEMQSLNEELQTVNAQLQSKLDELAQASDDIQNLLNSTEIATIFLDGSLRIKRFTAEARQIIKLIPGDIGRPIGDLVANLEYDELEQDAAEVMRTLVFREKEVRTKSGDWRLVRIMPYRTTENMIDGLVVTFIDINKIKRAEEAAEAALVVSNGIVDTIRESLLVLDPQFRVISANRAFFRTFQLHPGDVEGREFFQIADNFWNGPEVRTALEKLAVSGDPIEDVRLTRERPDGRTLTFLLRARRLRQPAGEPHRLLLVMEDISPWRLELANEA